MQLLGLEPIAAALMLTAGGVALSVLIGWLKSDDAIDPRQVVASGLIGFVVSIQLVIAQLEALPDDLSNLAAGAVVFALLAQVSGVDMLAKNAAKVVARVRNKNI